VVATDAGGLPEVVEDGVTGFVVPKGDANAIATAVDTLLSDPALRDRMGKAGRERAVARFDWMNAARDFEQLYRNLIAAQGTSR